MIPFFADYTFDTSINYHHGAGSAWGHFAEKCCSLKWYAEPSCLNDGVLFSMKSPYAMLGYVAVAVKYFAEVMSNLVAVWQTSRSTNIPSGHNSFVFNNYTTASPTVAGSTSSHSFT